MLEAIRFVFFSSIEYLAIFTLMLSMFRLKPLEYMGTAAFVFLIMSLISFALRAEFDLSFVVPVVGAISYILVLTTVVRIPLLWSSIIAVSGLFIYGIIQGVIILTFFGSYTSSMQYSSTGTLIQIISIIITLGICYVLHYFKFGFVADFEKFKFKFEHIFIVVFTSLALIAISVLMYYNNLFYIIIFLLLLAGIFIYYSVLKERAAYD